VVAVEDASRPVARHRHGDPLGNSGPDHVPHRRAAEVVEEPVREAGRLARRPPRLAEVPKRAAVPVEDEQAVEAARGGPAGGGRGGERGGGGGGRGGPGGGGGGGAPPGGWRRGAVCFCLWPPERGLPPRVTPPRVRGGGRRPATRAC